ncbi:DUF4167 domain-containing protein [Ciceribacter sp. RN22]|uniref:DUF4167 domain-containing protein n=1 Tax=Ciceribacter sp. RN22 TaxID=2954932 RepID=UPI0020926D0C|nr:DUF4167 domain-containing protein [Ciceribacter sp. RN22]MCO6180184.1 DUF4167 domain-containing protein [Ciceribacter sp. RN22]
MRPGQQNKRGRGRGGNGGGGGNFNRKGANPLTRTYDSSGPDVKIRGTAQHIAEKYAALARDAQSSGDRVMAENYLQHAEHYNRIIAAAQAQMQERFQRDDRGDYADRDVDDMDILDEPTVHHAAPAAPRPAEIAGSGPQPVIEGTPVEVAAAEEAAEEGGEQRQPRRRNSGSRPRRQRRGGGGGAQADDAGEVGSTDAESSSEKPELAAAASE